MGWTVLWFQNQQKKWEQRVERCKKENKLGHQAYAEKQVDMWQKFVRQARQGFKGMMIDI
jgi:hypothetical protein